MTEQMFENMAFIILEDYATSYSIVDKDTLARYLQKTFNDYLISNSITVNEWISVEDRLPDAELVKFKALDWDVYPCLVTIKNKKATDGRYVGKAFFYDKERFLTVNCVDITSDVTHWMPLPQPPKEVE